MQAKVSYIRQLSAGQQASSDSRWICGQSYVSCNLSRRNPLSPKAVETRVSTAETCIIGGITFTSDSSVGVYVTTHAVPSCAMFWDLFSMFVCMSDQGLTSKERLDEIYSAEKGKTGSALQGKLVASMTHKRPMCLYGFKLACLDQGFYMCKTYEHWIGAGTHVSYQEELSTR